MMAEDSIPFSLPTNPIATGLSYQAITNIAEKLAEHIEYEPGRDVREAVYKLGGRVDVREQSPLANGRDWNLHVRDFGDFTIRLSAYTRLELDQSYLSRQLGHYVLHYVWARRGDEATEQELMATDATCPEAASEADLFEQAFLLPEAAVEGYCSTEKLFPLIAAKFGITEATVEQRCSHISEWGSSAVLEKSSDLTPA